MSYNDLFKNSEPPKAEVAKPNKNLFGEAKVACTAIDEISDWKAGRDIQTSANRINFILNGIPASKLSSSQISDIGCHHVTEATEANRCVDVVVTEFAEMKPHLESPKQLILEAVKLIEGDTKPKGLLSFLSRSEPLDLKKVRDQVKVKTDDALRLVKACVQYRLDPFIEGLGEAKETLATIITDLDNTINALDFVIEKVTDPLIQDLARRRKEMFTKSLTLMRLNAGQLDSMTAVCEKNKYFATELEMTVLPVIENVMRAAVIDDGKGTMEDISAKLKGIL